MEMIMKKTEEMLPVSPEIETAMLEELYKLAGPHAKNSNGTLERLEINPGKYPAQKAYLAYGSPQPHNDIDTMAGLVVPDFADMSAEAVSSDQGTDALEQTDYILSGGGNVIVATSHAGLIDPAIALGTVYSQLRKQECKFASAIMISKMVTMLARKVGDEGGAVPAVDVLRMLCDDIYLTFPRTKSMRKSELTKLMPAEIKLHNERVKETLRAKLGQGGLLLAMAPSGATDKLGKDKKAYVLEGVGDGTADIMMNENTFVLPVALELEGDKPFIEICGNPRHLTSREQASGVLREIAQTRTKHTQKRFVFSRRTRRPTPQT